MKNESNPLPDGAVEEAKILKVLKRPRRVVTEVGTFYRSDSNHHYWRVDTRDVWFVDGRSKMERKLIRLVA
jgi:hypothetical protein